MSKTDWKTIFVLLMIVSTLVMCNEESQDDEFERIDPGMHLATDHQLTIRSADGKVM